MAKGIKIPIRHGIDALIKKNKGNPTNITPKLEMVNIGSDFLN